MEYLVKDQELELRYEPGNGAFTYHILLPNTSHIKGRWGFLKASGTIDEYLIRSKNLFTISGRDKMMAVNAEIRKTLHKTAGDRLRVTLWLDQPKDQVKEEQILISFADAGVLEQFKGLKKDLQKQILSEILAISNEQKQVKKILAWIDQMAKR